MNIGLEIKQLARKKNILILDLCKKIGITQSGLNLAFKNNTLKIRDLEKISEVLEVPVSYFFNEQDTSDCIKYKKGYFIYRKYARIISESIHHYQHIFEYFENEILNKNEYSDLKSFSKFNEELLDNFYKELFNIYEIQELFIKSYYTKETDGELKEYKKWEEFEKKGFLIIKSYENAKYKHLRPLETLEIRKGYEKYFKTQIM